jgi:hypothetical protein
MGLDDGAFMVNRVFQADSPFDLVLQCLLRVFQIVPNQCFDRSSTTGIDRFFNETLVFAFLFHIKLLLRKYQRRMGYVQQPLDMPKLSTHSDATHKAVHT